MNDHGKNSEPVVVISTVHGMGHGAETVLENLLRVWHPQLPLILVAPPGARVLEIASMSGISTIPLATSRDALLSNLKAIGSLRAALPRAGIFHAWHPRGFELAWLLGRLQRRPATGTLHDHARAYYFGRWRRCLIRFAANRFAGVVAVSQATANVAKSCGLKGPFSVVLNGVADAPRPPEPRPKWIGFLGMNAPAKGFGIVQAWIDATADLDWGWRLYGDLAPELAPGVQGLVRRCPNRVFFRGRQDAATIFQEIGILVHASTAFETLGMVLLEAGRAGIPAVASNVGGTPEVVIDGASGFLFQPNSPAQGLVLLRRLMLDPELRQVTGNAARDRFDRYFRAERMAEGYAAFWRQIRERK